jgi:2-C-methyl-D-erythritol 4-phosphate cytidylyltransferase
MKFYTIIPASGYGKRFKSGIPKQFLKLGEKEIISYVIHKFNSLKDVEYIIISTQKKYFKKIAKISQDNGFEKVKHLVEGGKERMDSVYNALCKLICNNDDYVIIHDAVRPFITTKKVKELIKAVKKYDSVVPALKINDTIKEADKKLFFKKSIKRDNLYKIQTPQIFRYDILMDAFNKAYTKKFNGTDESSIVQFAGYPVKIIEGEVTNIKITTKEDLRLDEFLNCLKK